MVVASMVQTTISLKKLRSIKRAIDDVDCNGTTNLKIFYKELT